MPRHGRATTRLTATASLAALAISLSAPAQAEFVGQLDVSPSHLWPFTAEAGAPALAASRPREPRSLDDIYGGYQLQMEDVALDVGYLNYGDPLYAPASLLEPRSTEEHAPRLSRLFLGAQYKMFSARYSYGQDYLLGGESDHYLQAGLNYSVAQDVSLGLSYGVRYDGREAPDVLDRGDYRFSVNSGPLSFSMSAQRLEDLETLGRPYFSLSWDQPLDLF